MSLSVAPSRTTGWESTTQNSLASWQQVMMQRIENWNKRRTWQMTNLHNWCRYNLVKVWDVSAQFQTYKFNNIAEIMTRLQRKNNICLCKYSLLLASKTQMLMSLKHASTNTPHLTRGVSVLAAASLFPSDPVVTPGMSTGGASRRGWIAPASFSRCATKSG